jgi:hypothetical protein
MIGAPARQFPGGDLVPFGASSTQRDEIVPVFATLAAARTDHVFRHGHPVGPLGRDGIRAIEP